jgi:hypothetical protein
LSAFADSCELAPSSTAHVGASLKILFYANGKRSAESMCWRIQPFLAIENERNKIALFNSRTDLIRRWIKSASPKAFESFRIVANDNIERRQEGIV